MILRAERMAGVKPPLIAVIIDAGSLTDFIVTCGLRTHDEQVHMVATGKSQTMNSKHLTGDAVDLAVLDAKGAITWDFPLYAKLAEVIKACAVKRGVHIAWGGDWKTLKDGPHFELVKEVSV